MRRPSRELGGDRAELVALLGVDHAALDSDVDDVIQVEAGVSGVVSRHCSSQI
jgi:hypothetical protein